MAEKEPQKTKTPPKAAPKAAAKTDDSDSSGISNRSLLIGLLVAALAFAFGYAIGRSDDDAPSNLGEEIAAWAECLEDAGATVPGVDVGDDGGFTVTFGASFLREFELGAFFEAAAHCQELQPRPELLERFGVLPEPRFEGPFEGEHDPPLEFLEEGPEELAQLCRRLIESDRLPGLEERQVKRLLQVCERR